MAFADDDSAVVHGVLTEDNLFDGSIITQTENYYIEPAHKYSTKLNENGIHTIVYKTSDVLDALPKAVVAAATAKATATSGGDDVSFTSTSIDGNEHYCASERLRRKVKNEFKRRRKSSLSLSSASWSPLSTTTPSFDNDVDDKRKTTTPKIISDSKSSFNKIMNEIVKLRSKRWLPDEVCLHTQFTYIYVYRVYISTDARVFGCATPTTDAQPKSNTIQFTILFLLFNLLPIFCSFRKAKIRHYLWTLTFHTMTILTFIVERIIIIIVIIKIVGIDQTIREKIF